MYCITSVFEETEELWRREYCEAYLSSSPETKSSFDSPISLNVGEVIKDQQWWPHLVDYVGGRPDVMHSKEWQETAFRCKPKTR